MFTKDPQSPFTKHSGLTFGKDDLYPQVREAFDIAKAELPDVISERLKCSRSMGPVNNLIIFDVWDKYQTDVIPRQHFKYCFNYCATQRPNKQRPQDGQFHLWLNKIRLYKNREEIMKKIEEELPSHIPPGFEYIPHDRAYGASIWFYIPEDLDLLKGLMVNLYKDLISSVHPLLMEIIDDLASPITKEELRKYIAERGKIPFQHPGVCEPDRVREYTRSIPPSLRKDLLKKTDYQCQICSADLHVVGHHIDHIVPFSKGGLTVEENLQALCPQCNLKKGNKSN